MFLQGGDLVSNGVAAVILAGGSGSRLGGNKVLHSLAGRPLAQYVADVVTTMAGTVVVASSSEKAAMETIAGLRWPTVTQVVAAWDGQGYADHNEGLRRGPLAGIRAGLAASRAERCMVLGCDMPFLCRDLLMHLVEVSRGHDAAVPRTGPIKALEPLCAVYSQSCIPVMDGLLEAGVVRTTSLFAAVDSVYVDADACRLYDRAGLCFFNVNTPSDHARAEDIIAARCL